MTDTPATHRDQVRSEPRPTPLGAQYEDLRERVAAADTQDTWKVFRKEWITIWTGTREECESLYTKKYEGRLKDGDFVIGEDVLVSSVYKLGIRIWNERGQWKDLDRAEAQAEQLGGETRVVGRSSRDEILLKDYGIKKLVGIRERLAQKQGEKGV